MFRKNIVYNFSKNEHVFEMLPFYLFHHRSYYGGKYRVLISLLSSYVILNYVMNKLIFDRLWILYLTEWIYRVCKKSLRELKLLV